MKVERQIEIGAPPDRVYDALMDPQRLEDWVTIHEALEDAPDGALERGSRLTQRLNLAGRSFKVRWTVIESDRPRRVVWEGAGPARSKAGATYELEATGGGEGTRFTYLNEYELPGGPLGKLAGRTVSGVAGSEADKSLARLKTLLEG